MKLSRQQERELLLTIQREPTAHIVFPEREYVRHDGALTVHRDGVQELLHRRMFRLSVNAHLGRHQLLRSCSQFGCVNPWHYTMQDAPRRGAHRVCPNGHVYAEVGVTESGHCAICTRLRIQARQGQHNGMAERNAAKTVCPAGHPYDAANTYRQRTASGYRRKCRKCAAIRAAKRRVALDMEGV